jgi:hypothetical protein
MASGSVGTKHCNCSAATISTLEWNFFGVLFRIGVYTFKDKAGIGLIDVVHIIPIYTQQLHMEGNVLQEVINDINTMMYILGSLTCFASI